VSGVTEPEYGGERRLDTAHVFWDAWWGGAGEPDAPEPAVVATLAGLEERGARRVADVGAGAGRHALAFARAGFPVVAVDESETGLEQLAAVARAEGLPVDCRRASFTQLPLTDGYVDHVLAWNVVYHGDRDVVRAAFQECCRVLRPGGTFHVTMLSKRHRTFGVGREVRPDTFVDDAGEVDRAHPHVYVDAATLCRLLHEAGFEPLSIVDVDQHPPGGWHWAVLAEVSGAGPALG
jgi:tellurite methyltransferase